MKLSRISDLIKSFYQNYLIGDEIRFRTPNGTNISDRIDLIIYNDCDSKIFITKSGRCVIPANFLRYWMMRIESLWKD